MDDWRGNSVAFVHNLSGSPHEFCIDTGIHDERGRSLVDILSNEHSTANEAGRHRILLEPYGYRWYRVGGLDYLMTRTDA